MLSHGLAEVDRLLWRAAADAIVGQIDDESLPQVLGREVTKGCLTDELTGQCGGWPSPARSSDARASCSCSVPVPRQDATGVTVNPLAII